MKKSKATLAIVLVAVIAFVGGIIVGRSLPQEPDIAFYATVIENNGTNLLVEGIPENDINHRGQFEVSIDSKCKVLNSSDTSIDTNIPIEDITPGSLVRITYTGEVQETSPARIQGAKKVQLILLPGE